MTPESRRALRELRHVADTLAGALRDASATLERVTDQITRAESPISYSVPQAARVCGRSAWSLRAAIRRGELPATRIGQDYYVLAADLRAYLGERHAA